MNKIVRGIRFRRSILTIRSVTENKKSAADNYQRNNNRNNSTT